MPTKDINDIIRDHHTDEWTFVRCEKLEPVDTIEGLSYDAAVEIARASSIAGHCLATCPHVDGVLTLSFKDGVLVNRWIGEKE